MRAVVVDRWMEPSELTVRDLPEPESGPGTLGVEVRAAGCNFFDILMARGQYQVKPPFPFVPVSESPSSVRAASAKPRSFFTTSGCLSATFSFSPTSTSKSKSASGVFSILYPCRLAIPRNRPPRDRL